MMTGSRINETTYRIAKVSPPLVKSNSRCGCVLDSEKANEFIADDYERSEHTRSYVGEWHTHPEREPHPSGIDLDTITSTFVVSALDFPLLVMVIVGTESLYFSVYDGAEFANFSPQEI